jgi:hypothetical protein
VVDVASVILHCREKGGGLLKRDFVFARKDKQILHICNQNKQDLGHNLATFVKLFKLNRFFSPAKTRLFLFRSI